ncbi:MAG: hypothetical protein AB1416_09075 [Actinomycetota bacterium]
MSGTTGAVAPPRLGERILDSLRHIAGVVAGGVLGALLWLIVMQQGPEHELTDHDFNQIMGQVFVDRSADVAKAGLWGTFAFGILIACLYPPVFHRMERHRGPVVAAAAFAVVPFLLWGIAFSPVVTAFVDVPTGEAPRHIPGGPFGSEGGAAAVILGLVASAVYATMASRAYSLMSRRDWWERRYRRSGIAQETIVEIVGDPSLELAEQVPEERGETPGR